MSYVKELQEDVTADLECLLIRTIGPSWLHMHMHMYTSTVRPSWLDHLNNPDLPNPKAHTHTHTHTHRAQES